MGEGKCFHNLEGANDIEDYYKNISQYFDQELKDLSEDELIFIRNDCSDLIGELESLIQRMEK